MNRTLNQLALPVVAGGILLAGPAQAGPGPHEAAAGYVMVQGRQVLLLTGSVAQGLAERAAEIRRRLAAAVSKDGTLQPVGRIRITDVAGTPVLSVGDLPIASVTPRDAARAGQPAWAIAHRGAEALEASLATLGVGGPVPAGIVTLKSSGGQYVALAPAPEEAEEAGPLSIALKNGRMTATIADGVVTLSGHAVTLAEKMEVARRIAEVPGVVDVVNQVAVMAPRLMTDRELASALDSVVR